MHIVTDQLFYLKNKQIAEEIVKWIFLETETI